MHVVWRLVEGSVTVWHVPWLDYVVDRLTMAMEQGKFVSETLEELEEEEEHSRQLRDTQVKALVQQALQATPRMPFQLYRLA